MERIGQLQNQLVNVAQKTENEQVKDQILQIQDYFLKPDEQISKQIRKVYFPFLEKNDFASEKFYLYLQNENDDSHKTFFKYHLIKNLRVFDYYKVFFKRSLLKNIYEKKQSSLEDYQVCSIFKGNHQVQGHINMFHGGFTSVLMDEINGLLAWIYANDYPVATRDLQITYKRPVSINEVYLLKVFISMVSIDSISIQSVILDVQDKVYIEGKTVFKIIKKSEIFTNFDPPTIRFQKMRNFQKILEEKIFQI